MRKAIVRNSDGFVINIIEIEQGANWQPPGDSYLIDAGNGETGDTWDGENFIKPEPIIPEPPRDLAAEIDELKSIYDADADGRIERDALEWAVDKLLKGAGEGVDPVLIDVPSGMPADFADLSDAQKTFIMVYGI